MEPAIFLDRDGVIIENRPSYVRSWADVTILPLALEALAHIHASPFRIVIVTNQSAVGRGLLGLEEAWEINHRLLQVIEASGGRVDGVFMCPHSPADHCNCRKPKPGLLKEAAESLALDLSRSIMIGDALSDVLAGQAAGVQSAVLVRTGRGASQEMAAAQEKLEPFLIFDTLADALANLVGRDNLSIQEQDRP
jgi:D-glycero-D-manno-heptose 1,7-bisphosphate phosphatase